MPPSAFLPWFFLIWSLGWLFFPFARRVFGEVLPDAGLAVGRVLALAFWTLGAFWLGNAGVSTRIGSLGWLILAGIGIGGAARDRAAIRAEIRVKKRAMFASDAIFLLVFLFFFALRGFWSDTSGNNGEKGMDGALIASLSRAQKLPPPNPYSAGSELRGYYYFGHLETALLTDATGTTMRWSYNLMCATLPALCFSTLFSLGAALSGRLLGGGIVSGAVLGLGTLQPILQWLHPENFDANTPFHLNYFATSRLIPYAINEYPFFTFNQADLHAHYFDFPFALATICLALALFRGQKSASLPAILVLGVQILTNTWDFPAYALLLILAIWGASFWVPIERKISIIQRAALSSVVLAGALLVAAPYLLHLKSAASPPKWLPFPASPLREWLLLWAPFGAVWMGFLAYFAFPAPRFRALCVVLGAGIGFLAAGSAWFSPPPAPFLASPLVLPLILVWLAFSMSSALKLRGEPRFLCFLAIAGLVALAWSETTWAGFLGDAHNLSFDDSKRQDTVFKFGLQTWLLWGIAASCGVCLTWRRWPEILKCALIVALPVMFLSSAAATFGRARNFSRWDGWDSWAHLAPSEKMAARWLEIHTSPGQNLLEAEQREGGDYSDFTRYAHATGIATIIGPQAHSFQWSPAQSGDAGQEWAEVFARKAAARAFYTANDAISGRAILRRYGVRYIVFGQLERDQYGDAALDFLRSNFAQVAAFGASGDEHEVWIFSA